jgi:serine protease AprX
MKNFLTLSIALSFFAIDLNAQNKFWVQLKNKNGTPYSVSTPTAFLTQRSVQRRIDYNIPVNQSDLPVNPAYISQIASVSGVTVNYVSKWLNALVVTVVSPTCLVTINSFTYVNTSNPVNKLKLAPLMKLNEPEQPLYQRTNVTTNYYGRSQWQLKQLGVDCIHQQGKRGAGMVIAVLDDGFRDVNVNPIYDSLYARNGVLGTRDFVAGDNLVYDDDTHGAFVLSTMAALVPSLIVGSAPDADYWLLRTEDAASEKPIEEYNWIRGVEFADSVGADICTTSLGYTTFDQASYNHTYTAQLNGKTIPMSIAATMAARKGMFLTVAAGNEGNSGWHYISVPADADSICTVGAIDTLLHAGSFTSWGPSADGRRKPNLSAMGVDTWGCASGSIVSCQAGSGTSFATPLLAGAVACFWQAHKSLNCIKLLDTLTKCASRFNNPDMQVGWGIPHMCCTPVSIQENTITKYPNELQAYPNPLSAKCVITTDSNSGSNTIVLFNSIGEVISPLVFTLSKNSCEVDLSNFPSGIYFAVVRNEKNTRTFKLIKL